MKFNIVTYKNVIRIKSSQKYMYIYFKIIDRKLYRLIQVVSIIYNKY